MFSSEAGWALRTNCLTYLWFGKRAEIVSADVESHDESAQSFLESRTQGPGRRDGADNVLSLTTEQSWNKYCMLSLLLSQWNCRVVCLHTRHLTLPLVVSSHGLPAGIPHRAASGHAGHAPHCHAGEGESHCQLLSHPVLLLLSH